MSSDKFVERRNDPKYRAVWILSKNIIVATQHPAKPNLRPPCSNVSDNASVRMVRVKIYEVKFFIRKGLRYLGRYSLPDFNARVSFRESFDGIKTVLDFFR